MGLLHDAAAAVKQAETAGAWYHSHTEPNASADDHTGYAAQILGFVIRQALPAEDVVQGELRRREQGRPAGFEIPGQARINEVDFTLTAKADRIDLDANGNALIYDYKTGAMSTPNQQKSFDLQLLLEAAMAEQAGFKDLDPRHVVRAAFIGLGANTKEVDAPLEDLSADEVWARFSTLIQQYFDADQPYTSRRAMFKADMEGDYDHLARFGEWDVTALAERSILT